MLKWFRDLLGLKTSEQPMPTNYDGLLKSDMLYEMGVLNSLLEQIRCTKESFEGIDNNIVLKMVYAEDCIKQSIESLNCGLEDCYDDSNEDGEYPVYMSWNSNEN